MTLGPEGNGKSAKADRRRYFEIARGSAFECAAIQDVFAVGKALTKEDSREHKVELGRIAAMLGRLGGRGYCVREEIESYGESEFDFDPDPDSDFDSESDRIKTKGGDGTSLFPTDNYSVKWMKMKNN